MIFQDRRDAGEKLARELEKLKLIDPLVLALPRGGVPVACAVARRLACPLDIIPLMKIPIPWNPEASYGVVAMDGTIALNKPLINRLELSERELEVAAAEMLDEAKRREQLYRGTRPFPDLENRTVILTDDGLASGYSMLAAVSFSKKRRPRSIIVASPIASDIACRMLVTDKQAEGIVTLVRDSEPVFSFLDYYREYKTLTDDDVLAELSSSCWR